MSNRALVLLALKEFECSESALAATLDVPVPLITQWIQGEHMPYDTAQKLQQLIGLEPERMPDLILTVGGKEQADKWNRLVLFIAKMAVEAGETGYPTSLLDMECGIDFLTWQIIQCFQDAGINVNDTYPFEFGIKDSWDNIDDETYDDIVRQLDASIYATMIKNTFSSFVALYGFYLAYLADIVYAMMDEEFHSDVVNIEPCLMVLAFVKTNANAEQCPNIHAYKQKTMVNYQNWLEQLKSFAIKKGIPLKAEVMDLIYKSPDDNGAEAEEESLGLNAGRLHPDIYMNELLEGMRMIHQVLPVIGFVSLLGFS